MHSLRIAVQGIELLSTGRITLPVPEPHRSRLMAVRRGEPSLDQVVADLDAATTTLAGLVDASRLPDVVDPDPVDRFIVAAYERAWSTVAE
jgi:uncharacterized protein